MNERDRIDDLIRSKLQDFEVDTHPCDWEAIANRLPRRTPVPLYRQGRWGVAAAVIALLILGGGLYLFEYDRHVNMPLAEGIQEHRPPVASAEQALPVVKKNEAPFPRTGKRKQNKVDLPVKAVEDEGVISMAANAEDEKREDDAAVESPLPEVTLPDNRPLIADASVAAPAAKTSARKWGFGMNAGGVSVASNDAVPSYVTHTAGFRSESLMLMNSATYSEELPKTDIKHKMPVSFGMGVSRYLDKGFALQTGLTYTYLASEWNTNGKYHAREKQRLHFIGIPLSLSYQIAEWNRFRFYTSAGIMGEMNVAGSLHTQLLKEENSEDIEINEAKTSVRMKEFLWSVHANAGVSYPVIRFLSAYAEIGAGYYFDNGSRIETIHSEKPFNMNFQFGLRLGF